MLGLDIQVRHWNRFLLAKGAIAHVKLEQDVEGQAYYFAVRASAGRLGWWGVALGCAAARALARSVGQIGPENPRACVLLLPRGIQGASGVEQELRTGSCLNRRVWMEKLSLASGK